MDSASKVNNLLAGDTRTLKGKALDTPAPANLAVLLDVVNAGVGAEIRVMEATKFRGRAALTSKGRVWASCSPPG